MVNNQTRSRFASTLVLNNDVSLSYGMGNVFLIDCNGSARIVTLPSYSNGEVIEIVNISSTSVNISLIDTDGNAVATLTQSSRGEYQSSATAWSVVTPTSTLDGLTDVTITGTPADNEVLAYDTGSGEFINQTATEASLAAASHTHSAADLSSGTLADARVAESNVTQHDNAIAPLPSNIQQEGATDGRF